MTSNPSGAAPLPEAVAPAVEEQGLPADFAGLAVTDSPPMREVLAKVRAAAPTRTTVLLTGETGTGKSLVARLIHHFSRRAEGPFLSLHCGAIPDTLLESELFGHEKGAFTGAVRRKAGKFELARGGTLFLDEIGTVSPSTQIKLLEVLQERRFARLGGEETLEADVRIVAATNEDLQKLCAAGSFRIDLFYRLNVFPIEVPPLSSRREDIPALVQFFVRRLNLLNGRDIREVHPLVLEAFQHYRWPGNVRELENLLERACILETSPVLRPESFPAELFLPAGTRPVSLPDTRRPLAEARRRAVEELEQRYLMKLLAEHQGRLEPVARAAGIGVRQLHKLMTRYRLHKEDFRPPRRRA